MEPSEYEHLEQIAASRGVSVAELIRYAIRQVYPLAREDRYQLVESICSMQVDLPESWDRLEEEIEEAHLDGLS
ncbi:MAG: ribbon-helix-helix protein, CopG family [Deltaproteobacteria bacterium]|nr:ribbon-helix-helix protein, CopG family [Deltaproteobacteria bacterium]